jgi:hypothetical protein
VAEIYRAVTFESDGIHVWVKIGEHCRAMLGPIEETRLREWLIKRDNADNFGAWPEPKTLTLQASSRVS